uniref:Uncharacterized protein n=1 Tax=Anopheles coluzzii TaxID=1518534 RepID=A0A8W7Q136_ANOCL
MLPRIGRQRFTSPIMHMENRSLNTLNRSQSRSAGIHSVQVTYLVQNCGCGSTPNATLFRRQISLGSGRMSSGAMVDVVGSSVTVQEFRSPGRHTNSRSENTNPGRQERSRACPSRQLTYLLQSSGWTIVPSTMPRHMSVGSG